MSAKARRKITVTYSNDVEGETEINAAENTDSPASVQLVTLPALSDDNFVPVEVDVPEGATAVTIMKPGDNASAIMMTGTEPGDLFGIQMHPTDPDTISLASSVTSFWLTASTAAADVVVRLFWS